MNDPRSYNLLYKPWIPVVWGDGAPDPKCPNTGISEALRRAHEITAISHTAPFIEFGLYRLLITIVLDAYICDGQRPTIGKMKQMLEAGKFDCGIIENYLQKHSDRFDLWASDNPFLQRVLRAGNAKEPSPKAIVAMFAAVPSGTNVAHWNHFREDEIGVTEDTAAQLLTTVSPWNFKTKPGEARTLAGDPPMYALVLGKNLFETIVLNLPRPTGRVTTKQEQASGPAWRTQLDLTKLAKVPTYTQGFTWPVRIVKLVEPANGGATVTKAVNQASYKKPTKKAKSNSGNFYDAKYGWRDPNAGTETTPDSISHIKARPGVPIWRDAVPLFLVASEGEALRGERRRSRPEVISNALRVLDAADFRVIVYGMRKKSGGGGDVKVEEWFRSVLQFPAEVARDNRLSARAIDAFKTTQKVADALQTALRMLRPSAKANKGKRPPPGCNAADALSNFWQSLETALSRSYLDNLSRDNPAAEETLRKEIRMQARNAFKRAAAPHRRTADGLFRIANADNWFERRLAKLLPKSSMEESEESV